jgi:hypothetical protein
MSMGDSTFRAAREVLALTRVPLRLGVFARYSLNHVMENDVARQIVDAAFRVHSGLGWPINAWDC